MISILPLALLAQVNENSSAYKAGEKVGMILVIAIVGYYAFKFIKSKTSN